MTNAFPDFSALWRFSSACHEISEKRPVSREDMLAEIQFKWAPVVELLRTLSLDQHNFCFDRGPVHLTDPAALERFAFDAPNKMHFDEWNGKTLHRAVGYFVYHLSCYPTAQLTHESADICSRGLDSFMKLFDEKFETRYGVSAHTINLSDNPVIYANEICFDDATRARVSRLPFAVPQTHAIH